VKRVLVAVIAYNEEKNLPNTLRDLREYGPQVDIVVIDNGSTDRTKDVAIAAGVPVVSHCVNSGGSMGTVMSYFLYAHRNRYDCLCQFDGDGQHVAAELTKIIAPVLEGSADYVIGSRFLSKEGFQSYFLRRLARFSRGGPAPHGCDFGIPRLWAACSGVLCQMPPA
jgi:glycosyltransferase involved in cell wall biosynthesis